MNRLEQDYRGDAFVKNIDIDDSRNAGLVQQFGVTAIPHIVVINDRGEIVTTFRGLTEADRLRAAFDEGLAQSERQTTTTG